jgi:putative DNA primase/helicase
MNFDNIPSELKNIDNWVLWKLENRKGKTTKIPYQLNNKMASSNNPQTWTNYNNALDFYNHSEGEYSGIGFMFSGSGITGIDIDHCIENGKIKDAAQSIINTFDSYTERSQSGSGIHILVKGSIPKAVKKDIEMYCNGRYFALTGDIIHGQNINERQQQLDALYKKYAKVQEQSSGTTKTLNAKLRSDDLLEKAFSSKDGSKIKALYNGQWQALGYESQSQADQALCNYLAFWFNKDFDTIDEVFKNSVLYREKWDRPDYKELTINNAINDCNKSYQEYMYERQHENSQVAVNSEYIYTNDKGKTCVNTGLLANYIRNNYNYMIVRKQGYDNDFLYWYESGYYKRMSANEFKGKIKQFIPVEIRKPNQWEESYKELITDKASIRFEDLNKNSKYINLKNGLYNIATGQLEKHNPGIRSTIQLNCNYNKSAKYPAEWMNFIKTFSNNDQEIMNILQEWFGLTLSNIKGSITKKCLSLWGIRGNTGKTQYGNMLIYLIGSDNICSTPIQDFSKTFGTGDIYGAKAIIIDDQKATNIDDSSVFKSITGGGYIRCEQKGKQAFPYEFTGTLTFGCNDLPYFKGDKGDHLFERFIIIPCNNVIPEEKRDGNIFEKFKPEADGIFLWALQGLHRLINNNFKFTHSEVCKQALEEYKCANDSLYNFIIDTYTITDNPKDRVKKTIFENKYSQWCSINDKQALEKKNISDRAAKHGILKLKSHGDFYYQGIIEK